MKVAIYARVSTEEQHADKQLYMLKEQAKRSNWEICKEYVDICSGAKSSRPALNQMLEDMRRYKFQAIAVTKLDRIGRSLQHLLSMFDEMKRKGVHFIAITQNIDTTSAAGNLQMQIMGAFAEFERNLISERTKEGLKRATGIGKR
jgi:DNA invertase Pin-like site-specific DNA recombinase